MKIEQMSEEEREEIVQYGLKRGKIILLSTIVTITIGAFLGIIWQSIVFWFSLSILRKYIGGYHSNTEKSCYAISFIVVVVSLFCVKSIDYNGKCGIILQILSFLAILILAPVENTNHILDEEEKRKYGIKGKVIASMLFFVYIFLYFTNKFEIMAAIATAFLTGTILLILGYLKIHKKSSYNSKMM